MDAILGVERCIRPSLEEVNFSDYEPDEEVLYLLEIRCPKLKKITFDCYKLRILNTRELTKFIQRCRSLRSISLSSKFSGMLTGQFYDYEIGGSGSEEDEDIVHVRQYELLKGLALRGDLEELELNPDVGMESRPLFSFETFHMVLRDIKQQPFMSLRKLEAVMDETSPTILAPKLNPNTLTTLDLTIKGLFATLSMLPEICTLVNLQHLSITYDEAQPEEVRTFPSSDMLALGKLKHLRRLKITNLLPLSPKLTDEEFSSIVENWHELEYLDLDCDGAFSIKSLTSLGQNCPRLKSCSTYGNFDMDYWQNVPRPIFPVIEDLQLTCYDDDLQ